jgi:hypothetical protein
LARQAPWVGDVIKAILAFLAGPIAGELRQAYKDRLNAANNEQRIAADIRIKELTGEADERRQKLADPLLKTPIFVSEFFVSLYIAAIMIDSTFPSNLINPLELPEWFKPHFSIVVASIYGASLVSRYLPKRK